MTQPSNPRLLISRGWLQATVLVFLFGFFVLGLLAYRVNVAQPPVPERVETPSKRVVFTGDDVMAGQKVFLSRGLMQYGSIFGHGGYLGPDYTADYLRRAAEFVKAEYAREQRSDAGEQTAREFKTNLYDPETRTLTYTEKQAAAFDTLRSYYGAYFSDSTSQKGLKPSAITDPDDHHGLTAFFAWSAWAGSALRPGKDYSYTNNWPPEPRVGNEPTGAMVTWSVLSLVALLGGIGVLLAAFGRWNWLGWHGSEERAVLFRRPGEVALTPGQRATAWFFFVMAALFVAQALLGGSSQHYRAEISDFFGFDLAQLVPFNVARTWHVQLAIFWVATSFLAAGIFIAPMVARREPRGQAGLAYALLGALFVVVAGSLFGELAGVHGWILNDWFGHQGFEYLDLGRFWQVLLTIGLVFWVILVFRVLRTRLRTEAVGNMPWLFFFSALALPAFYAVGLVAHQEMTFTATEFWRFWVVHLWVEDFLELFTTVMVAYIFVLLGVVREKVALAVVYLDIVLYSVGGVIGTMHHLYFSGAPVEHMALGAFFSAAEVIPLTFLTLEAWTFLRIGTAQQQRAATPFPHLWAVMFLVSVGFWNFVGAGIFGFLINLPIVSYYEIGTALTANHAHAAMMGVYGMLAVGLALFALRYLMPDDKWSDRAAKISFWSLNIGLAWMVFATLFPLGILQLYESVSKGYFEARQLQFLTGRTVSLLEWLRLPGDIIFIVGGTLPVLWLTWRGVRHRVPLTTEEPQGYFFTEGSGVETDRP
jgi:nitric oxide reductase subunit B